MTPFAGLRLNGRGLLKECVYGLFRESLCNGCLNFGDHFEDLLDKMGSLIIFGVMRIGNLQVVIFKNFWLGPDFGKPVIRFYVRVRRSRVSINLLGRCLLITYRKRRLKAAR